MSSDSDEGYAEEEEHEARNIVRRGSEGYEVRPIDREEILRRYIEQGQEDRRYRTYVPEPDSEDSGDDSGVVDHQDVQVLHTET
jgi:palmitoyltransferase